MSFYEVLGVSPQSSQSDIRDAYRRESKKYHPDTTVIDKAEAANRFQALKQAYDTLRFPDKRKRYDQLLASIHRKQQTRSSVNKASPGQSNSAFLDCEDRPLSASEIFALFILGLTFLFCLLVALFLGISRGEMLVNSIPQDSSVLQTIDTLKSGSKAGQSGANQTASERFRPHDISTKPKAREGSQFNSTVKQEHYHRQQPLFPPMSSGL